jgi:hypothetical protein
VFVRQLHHGGHWARVLNDPAQRAQQPAKVALNPVDMSAAHIESIVARPDSLTARYDGQRAASARAEPNEHGSQAAPASIRLGFRLWPNSTAR